MNIESYISSGILELYVAGLLSTEEVEEVQRLSQAHPEILTEIRQIEEALESYAEHTTSGLPQMDFLKGVMNKLEEGGPQGIQTNGTTEALSKTSIQPKAPSRKQSPPDKAEKPESFASSPKESSYEKKFSPAPIPQKSFWSRNFYPIAATVLLLASLALNFFLYQRHENLSQVVTTLMREYHELKSETREKDVRLAVYENNSYKRAFLTGTERAEEASATVYWDEGEKSVYIKIHSIPSPAEGLQYQLWALQDGTPVNAGLLSVSSDLQKGLSIEGKAQAFAVTLEPRGGRDSPTLEQMYLQGNVGG